MDLINYHNIVKNENGKEDQSFWIGLTF